MTNSKPYLLLSLGSLLICLALVWVGIYLDHPSRVALGWIIGVIVLLSWGNWRLNLFLNQRIPWHKTTGKRFGVQMILGILYSLICINVSYCLFKRLFLGVNPQHTQLIVLNVYGLLFLLPVISAHVVIYTMMQWRKSMVYTESLKQEQVKSHLESLKSHLDPHFLFNNLNILSSLIDLDADRAQEFLGSFSEVYRYVLRQRGEELVPLHQELEFLDAYLYMLRQRFPTQIHLKIELDDQDRQRFIPPLALQMLIENAIKHNKATDASPLHIDISSADHQLVIRNTLQLKSVSGPGANFGLSNLRKRYEYLTDSNIKVDQTADYFQVTLPLIIVHPS
ncbi:MAG: histidine kinase [Bacteroidota bacterium]